ncbi:MAG TPA: SRPBCC family protein [Polyangiales bacterium]|nr:SRPBCC family protein [Polyangiales bacterium]
MAERKSETTLEQKGDRELVITRLFNAPARMVFEAWTQPELVRRWWAPASHEVAVVSIEADVRVGGTWRYVLKPKQHPQFAFYGEYHEVTPHTRLRYSSIFEPFPDLPTQTTVSFEARGEQTLLTSSELYASAEALKMALESGMEHGMRETMDQLDELVQSLGG